MGYLSTVGLTELIANDIDDYVELTVSLANDVRHLRDLRFSLRQRMLESPLCDLDKFTANLSNALTRIWCRWSEGEPATSFDL